MSGSEANLYLCFAFVFIYLYCVGDLFIKGIPLTGSGRKSFVQSQAKYPSSSVLLSFCVQYGFAARVIVD